MMSSKKILILIACFSVAIVSSSIVIALKSKNTETLQEKNAYLLKRYLDAEERVRSRDVKINVYESKIDSLTNIEKLIKIKYDSIRVVIDSTNDFMGIDSILSGLYR